MSVKTSEKLFRGDCLTILPQLSPACAVMTFADLPYGKTKLSWDCQIDLEDLWTGLLGVCPQGPWIFTAAQPFTTTLINSNPEDFRYTLVWDKGKGSNPLLSGKRPMSSHEDILVFYRKQPKYHPQMTDGAPYAVPRTGGNRTNSLIGNGSMCLVCRGTGSVKGPAPCSTCCGTGIVKGSDKAGWRQTSKDTSKRFPVSVLKFSIHCGSKLHPSQKPVELLEWLSRTYTDAGDTVLDPCMGSGTTGIACKNTKRGFIGIELDPRYYKIASTRISKEAHHR
jgi:site-specific DNA-methyltransferase (adenine-specific)